MSEFDFDPYSLQGINNEEKEMLSRWSLNIEKELFKIKLQLLGLEYNRHYGIDDDFTEYIQISGSALVNERGATAIHNKLQAELTKIPADTKLMDNDIREEVKQFDIDFSSWVAQNSVDFAISDKDYNTVCEMAIRLVKAQWFRSIGGWKGNLINNNTQQREVITHNTETEVRNAPRRFNIGGIMR